MVEVARGRALHAGHVARALRSVDARGILVRWRGGARMAPHRRGSSRSRRSDWRLSAIVRLDRPEVTRLVFGYAHNLVAIALWLTFFGGASRSAFLALGRGGARRPSLVLGGTRRFCPRAGAAREPSSLLWVTAFARRRLGSPLPSVGPGFRPGILTSFAFLQSVHYLLWLHVIPGQGVPGSRTRTLRSVVAVPARRLRLLRASR